MSDMTSTLWWTRYILTELAEYGDLRSVLTKLKESGEVLRVDELLECAYQISLGMEYLALRKFIHRDLACRNCLVSAGGVIKVSDFGMSRGIQESADYYRASDEDDLPIRWMAIESIEASRFTLRTDVWSFGVTTWEVFSYGARPYGALNNIMIPIKLPTGLRPEQPANCPPDLYALMGSCWQSEPMNRPPFTQVRQRLEGIKQDHKPADGVGVRCIGELSQGKEPEDPSPYKALNPGGGATYATTDGSGATKYEPTTAGAAEYSTTEDLAHGGYQSLSREDIDKAQRENTYGFLDSNDAHYKATTANAHSLYHNPDDLAKTEEELPPGLSANKPWCVSCLVGTPVLSCPAPPYAVPPPSGGGPCLGRFGNMSNLSAAHVLHCCPVAVWIFYSCCGPSGVCVVKVPRCVQPHGCGTDTGIYLCSWRPHEQ